MRVFSDSRVIHLVSSSRERIMGTGMGERPGVGAREKGEQNKVVIFRLYILFGYSGKMFSCYPVHYCVRLPRCFNLPETD